MTGHAYVDASAIVGVLFGEPSSRAVKALLGRLDTVYSSNLLEAEVRAAAARERVAARRVEPALSVVRWVFPHRSLRAEIMQVLDAGHLRGADLWHVACALYLNALLEPMPLVTLDARQREVAEAVGVRAVP